MRADMWLNGGGIVVTVAVAIVAGGDVILRGRM